MKPPTEIAFSDAGERILAIQFDYAGVDHESESEASSRAQDALQALQHGLLIVIRDGHKDAAAVRAGALARLCNLFASDAEAAKAVHVHRSSMMRAVCRMRTEIMRAAQQEKPASSPIK